MTAPTIERTYSPERRSVRAAVRDGLSRSALFNVFTKKNELPQDNELSIRKIVDALPPEEIDRRLSLLVSAAELAEANDEVVSNELVEDIDQSAITLVETMPHETYGQMAIVALAGAHHVTGNQVHIDHALQAIHESPTLQAPIMAPVVHAVERVAETGIPISDSLKLQRKIDNKAIPMPLREKSKNVPVTAEKHTPIGPGYDWVFDRSAPDQPDRLTVAGASLDHESNDDQPTDTTS